MEREKRDMGWKWDFRGESGRLLVTLATFDRCPCYVLLSGASTHSRPNIPEDELVRSVSVNVAGLTQVWGTERTA